MLKLETVLWSEGVHVVAGLDEVGRGCIAGPVVASAVVLSPVSANTLYKAGVRDSKALSAGRREALNRIIRECAADVAVGVVWPEEIDRLNILQASLKAMAVAVAGLVHRPNMLLVDGNQHVPCDIPQHAVVKGDSCSVSIAAASIIAKVYRDGLMCRLDAEYPEYLFHKHKGYPTQEHIAALERHGVSNLHRKSFGPVKRCVVNGVSLF
ncbi:MAG: ribonuclease HII [Dissulfuribacterales bacterium]